jgi:predicted XRE-type DNA-binding protein
MSAGKPESTVSSGNVFTDLGLPDSDELLAKADLAHQITSIAKHRHLTQTETARILGTTQPKVSDLFAGRLNGFSMERLIRFLNALDRDVQIIVTVKSKTSDRATVRVAGKKLASSRKKRKVVRHDKTLGHSLAGGV